MFSWKKKCHRISEISSLKAKLLSPVWDGIPCRMFGIEDLDLYEAINGQPAMPPNTFEVLLSTETVTSLKKLLANDKESMKILSKMIIMKMNWIQKFSLLCLYTLYISLNSYHLIQKWVLKAPRPQNKPKPTSTWWGKECLDIGCDKLKCDSNFKGSPFLIHIRKTQLDKRKG